MLSCKEATELNSQRFDRDLSAIERVKVRVHLFYCVHCRNVLAQFRFVEAALARYRTGGKK